MKALGSFPFCNSGDLTTLDQLKSNPDQNEQQKSMGKRVSFCVDEHYYETYSKEVRILLNFNLCFLQ